MESLIGAATSNSGNGSQQDYNSLALEGLVETVFVGYDHLGHYLEAIGNLTHSFISNNQEELALKALSFWMELAEKEIAISSRSETIHNFILNCGPSLVGLLLTALEQSEINEELANVDEVEEEQSLFGAVVKTLELISTLAGGEVAHLFFAFFINKVGSQDWKEMYRGLTALSICVPHANDGILS